MEEKCDVDSRVLAVGEGDAMYREGLQRWGWELVKGVHAAKALPAERRAQVTAIAFRGHESFGAHEMDAFPNLGLVSNFGAGTDTICVSELAARGIACTNTPDVLTDDVADLAVGMLISLCRDVRGAEAHVRSGAWARHVRFPLRRKVSGQRAGILGLGRIGCAIAKRLAAFDMRLHYYSRTPKPDAPAEWTYHADMVSLARDVDFLFVCCCGGDATRHRVSTEVIAALGPKGVLVNIARGTVVDEEALIAAMERHELAGACLDVFQHEPNIDPRFLLLDNAMLLPHQGSATMETRRAMGDLQRDNIQAFLSGEPLLTPVTFA